MPHDFVMESGLYALDLIGLHPFRKSGFGYVRAFVFSSTFLVMYILNVAGVIVRYEGIKSLADSVDAIPAGQQVLVKVFAVILIHDRFQKLFAKMDQMWPNNIYGSELELKIQTYQASFKRTFIAYRATIWITTITYISKPLLTLSRSFATACFPPSGDKLYRYIPYLISYNFQLYIYCVIGQEMSYQAENVGKSLYESTWYLSNQPKLRKGMIMVIQISQQQENKLSIGGIWDLNLRIFMSVIKTSVSVHAFMQTIYNENLQGTK
nr:uncharacterized protein LOC111421941 [Onthophagus taurus]